MKISKEYGGWITTSMSFVLITFYSISKENIIPLMFWIPVFIGLLLFDTKLKNLDKTSSISILSGIIFSLISILLFYFIIIPYLIFLLSYIFKYKKFYNYIVTFFGLLGLSSMIYFTLYFLKINFLDNSIFLLLYLYGAEFGVRSYLNKKFHYSLYNIIPIVISIFFNPIFLLSSVRFIYFKIKRIKYIGIIESIMYSTIIIYFIIIIFYKI
ncbi:MAG: hypothetical protein ACP5IB_02530 [Thermoplasmata archaeon]